MSRQIDSFYRELLRLHRRGGGMAALGMLEAPVDLSGFLNRLSRPDERLSELARQLGCSIDELNSAAYAFIRQHLFSPGNNHYQILGLASNAATEEIRRRYRLLISLFHPDRINRSEQWVDKAVRQLNNAYAVLKRPDKRRAYDASLQQTGDAATTRSRAPRGQATPRYRAPLSQPVRPVDALYRVTLLQRNPQAFVWLIIASLLILVMLVAISNRESTSLMLVDDNVPETRLADQVPVNPLIPTVILPEHKGMKTSVQALLPASGATVDSLHSVPSTPATSEPMEPSEAAANTAVEQAHKRVVTPRESAGLETIASANSAKRSDVRDRVPSFDGAGMVSAGSLPDMGQTADVKMISDAGSANMQPEFVLMRYIRAWERGDVEGLSRLFTLDASANERTGREQIKLGYQQVFDSTRQRRFSLEQLKIVPVSGNRYQAWAEISANADSAEDEKRIHYRGRMVFHLAPRGRRLYITRLRHDIQAEGK
ncbi:DnaJ domain-containing protein [Thiolapillus sp.]